MYEQRVKRWKALVAFADGADAVLDCGDGRRIVGRDSIREYYAGVLARGRKYEFGTQRPAMIRGDLALTSTHLPDGSVTAEVARRQSDGTRLYVIDRFSIEQRYRARLRAPR